MKRKDGGLKKMVNVRCPNCGAIFPFSVFIKQVVKRKIDRDLILQIIEKHPKITTGQLWKEYQIRSGKVVTLRQVFNVVKELEKEGKVKTQLIDHGRYGRTTFIKKFDQRKN